MKMTTENQTTQEQEEEQEQENTKNEIEKGIEDIYNLIERSKFE